MEKKVCSGCGKEKYIQNKTKNLCSDCVFERSHGGKSKIEVQYEKQKQSYGNRSGHSSGNRLRSGVKVSESKRETSTVRNKIKVTGEREMFLEIWEERPHYCTNPKCRKFLGHEPKVHFFSHIKPKSVYPELRLEKSNIRLLCFQCHYDTDHRGIKIEDE